MMYPNIRILAELAEDAGLDFRVVVLTRKLEPILTSTTVHRNFAPFISQVT